MGSRLELHSILQDITPNVYFQPPETLKLVYPCIVYSRDLRRIDHANNNPYRHLKRYQVIVIDRDPDSVICDELELLPTIGWQAHYVNDNLYHETYNIYY